MEDLPKKIKKTADLKKYYHDKYERVKADRPNRTCEQCGVTVGYYAMSKHNRSKAHIRNGQNFVIYTYNEQSSSDNIPSGEIHSEGSNGLAEEKQP
jgi:ribosomal protein S27AE